MLYDLLNIIEFQLVNYFLIISFESRIEVTRCLGCSVQAYYQNIYGFITKHMLTRACTIILSPILMKAVPESQANWCKRYRFPKWLNWTQMTYLCFPKPLSFLALLPHFSQFSHKLEIFVKYLEIFKFNHLTKRKIIFCYISLKHPI